MDYIHVARGRSGPNYASVPLTDSGLLNWWRSQTFASPTISQAAREFLPVPSAEVDCERLFSGNRDTIGVHRHFLKSEKIRVLELLRSSYQAERLEDLTTMDWDKHIQSIILKPDLFVAIELIH
jgi:hypothetical protein